METQRHRERQRESEGMITIPRLSTCYWRRSGFGSLCLRVSVAFLVCAWFTNIGRAQTVTVSPSDVNAYSQGATSVLLTFGGLINKRVAEATWCGALIPAAPDLGFKCDPATLFGRLPAR